MDFDIVREIGVEQGGKLMPTRGYVNEPLAIFAIAHFEKRWLIVHRPSGYVIANIFRTKREVEIFFDYFNELIDIDCLIFLNANEKALLRDFNPYFEKAYSRFYKKHRRAG